MRRSAGRSEYLDLLVKLGTARVAIELKYKTRRHLHCHGDEVFDLRSQSAQDLGRYDFLLDVQRVERFVQEKRADYGFAVLLTNDASYWSPAKRADTVDEMFRLLQGRVISGSLSWLSHASTGTTRGRTSSIELRKQYIANWLPYSTVSDSPGGEFRFLTWHVS